MLWAHLVKLEVFKWGGGLPRMVGLSIKVVCLFRLPFMEGRLPSLSILNAHRILLGAHHLYSKVINKIVENSAH